MGSRLQPLEEGVLEPQVILLAELCRRHPMVVLVWEGAEEPHHLLPVQGQHEIGLQVCQPEAMIHCHRGEVAICRRQSKMSWNASAMVCMAFAGWKVMGWNVLSLTSSSTNAVKISGSPVNLLIPWQFLRQSFVSVAPSAANHLRLPTSPPGQNTQWLKSNIAMRAKLWLLHSSGHSWTAGFKLKAVRLGPKWLVIRCRVTLSGAQCRPKCSSRRL